MDTPRRCGLLLHPTSLPGPYGIGALGIEDLGVGARDRAVALAEAQFEAAQLLVLRERGTPLELGGDPGWIDEPDLRLLVRPTFTSPVDACRRTRRPAATC